MESYKILVEEDPKVLQHKMDSFKDVGYELRSFLIQGDSFVAVMEY